MHFRPILRLLLALLGLFFIPSAAVRAADLPVDALPAHLAESGIPTAGEVGMVEAWLKTVAAGQEGSPLAQPWFDHWLGDTLPFSFRYDGRDFTGTGNGWQFQRGQPRREAGAQTQDWTWLHAKTGLKVVWHVKRFLDYPAVDTLLTFENTGSKDTALIEDVRNLDLKCNHSQPGKCYTLHAAHGGRCGREDFLPFARRISGAAGPSLTLLREDYEDVEIDRSVLKTPLMIGQRKFAHGLGVNSISQMCVHSPTPIARFSAWVGVDCNDQTRKGAGSVVFALAVRGGPEFNTPVLRGGQAPVKIDLDLRGTKEVFLTVGDAGDGPGFDYADWADAVFTLQGGRTVRLDELARAGFDTVKLGSEWSSSNQDLPFFNIETPEGRGVLVGFGWTGNWRAELTGSGAQLAARAGMPATHFLLHPGEKVRGPRVLLVFWNGPCLHGHNMLRRVIYEHYLPRLPGGKPHQPLVTVNTCFTYHSYGGYLGQATEKSLLALIPPFLEIGPEAMTIDFGYFKGDVNVTKDYSYDKQRFPRGLRPLADALAKAGVAFGVYYSPDIMGNLGDPKVREKFLAFVDHYVKTQGESMYREDGGVPAHDAPGADRVGVPEMQHIAGLYETLDELRRRHPNMLMEGCCGGGRRIDLETVSRFHWHQKSDSWFNTVTDQTGMVGGNLYLPGGVLNLPTRATDNFGLWSSFAGQLCLAWHPLDKDFPMELAKRQVKLYKRVRPYLCGDFYPLTDCTLEQPWLAYQFHRHDLGAGLALIFKRTAAQGDTFTFAPRGLDPQGHYAVSFQAGGTKAVSTGAELAKGVQVKVDKTPGAELAIYEKQ
jgi:alpha-galactosidase